MLEQWRRRPAPDGAASDEKRFVGRMHPHDGWEPVLVVAVRERLHLVVQHTFGYDRAHRVPEEQDACVVREVKISTFYKLKLLSRPEETKKSLQLVRLNAECKSNAHFQKTLRAWRILLEQTCAALEIPVVGSGLNVCSSHLKFKKVYKKYLKWIFKRRFDWRIIQNEAKCNTWTFWLVSERFSPRNFSLRQQKHIVICQQLLDGTINKTWTSPRSQTAPQRAYFNIFSKIPVTIFLTAFPKAQQQLQTFWESQTKDFNSDILKIIKTLDKKGSR